MSLRGKIEAVIYAAEEPVTLAQLAALFGAEALENAMPGSVEAQLARTQAEGVEAVQAELISEEPSSQADGFAGESTATASAQPATGDAFPDEVKRLARSRDRQAREQIRTLLDELMAEYDRSDRGVEVREIAGGYRVATRPEYHDAVRSFVKSLKPPMKLSLQALETLAVIAYKQPVTAPEVADIRGVDSSGVLGSLISRKLVTTAGRKAVVGRPILYKTTREFLLRFGLKDLAELPSMEEFEKMAGELVEEPESSPQLRLTGEPEQAADFQSAPEAAGARSDEEIAAAAYATVVVTDEDEPTVESDSGVVVEPAPSPAAEEAHAQAGLKEDG